jgi:electron transfer flavoprotein alpha/beta subunit
MAGVLKNTGETEKSAALLASLKGDAYVGPVGLTCYHLARGEIDSAVEWCGKVLELRVPSVIAIVLRANEPRLRQSAGWPALLAKANLKEAR